MIQEHLIKLSDKEIDDKYKKDLFLGALKEGKIPARKNFFKNIVYLCGFGRELNYVNTFQSNLENYTTCARLHFPISYHTVQTNQEKRKKLVDTPKFSYSLKRYLSDKFKITWPTGWMCKECLDIHYNREDMKWSLVDNDLLLEHPKNTEKRKNGFVYIKNYRR